MIEISRFKACQVVDFADVGRRIAEAEEAWVERHDALERAMSAGS